MCLVTRIVYKCFFVLCLVIRLMRDMVIVRPVVGDVLN